MRGSKNVSGWRRWIGIEKKLCLSGEGVRGLFLILFLCDFMSLKFSRSEPPPFRSVHEHCNIWCIYTGLLTCIPPLNSSVSKRGIHAVGINTLYDWLSKYPLSRIKIHVAWDLKYNDLTEINDQTLKIQKAAFKSKKISNTNSEISF